MSLVRQLESLLHQLLFNRHYEFLTILNLRLECLSYFMMLAKEVFSFVIIFNCNKFLCQLSMIVAFLPQLLKLKLQVPKSVVEHCDSVWIGEGFCLSVLDVLSN